MTLFNKLCATALAALLLVSLGACSREPKAAAVGSKAWCDKVASKTTKEVTDDEVAKFFDHCGDK